MIIEEEGGSKVSEWLGSEKRGIIGWVGEVGVRRGSMSEKVW